MDISFLLGIFSFFAFSASSVDAACTAEYGQCGGTGFTGPTCCVAGYECVFSNDYYSQCVPSTTRDPSCLGNSVWSQCGGQQFTGDTCCPAGSICVKQDDWYSQCKPISSLASSTPISSTKLSTTLKLTTTKVTTVTTKLPTSTSTSTTKATTKAASTTKTTTKPTTKPTTTTTKKPVVSSSTTQKITSTTKPSSPTTTKVATTTTTTPQGNSGTQPIYSNVLATEHQATESGSCALPEASYAVNYPVALGDIASLQTYRWRPEMCGHILRINCNVTSVDIIVSNSNLGGGMDLYKSTWETATNYKPPGITYCTVQLTSRNPFTTDGYQCYYEAGWSDWYHNVALLNTNDRIVIGAKFSDGRTGAHRGGNPFWAFDGYATLDTVVTFQFEDGGTYDVKLSDCVSGISKHIFS